MTSIIKVNNLQNQCGANIISESSNTITIGASGDTVTLAAGASQSGFGRSGSVNWDTTPKTTSPVTAVSGNGYFIDTTSGAITINLPSTPSAGDIVAVADYANTAATNNITVGRNGSNIDGSAVDGKIKINGQVYTLVYVDATEGWKTVGQTVNQIVTAQFVAATGGTITTCGDFKIHSFTGPGTFTVTSAGNPAGSTTVDYLVVAGGGGGGTVRGGGGAGGGYRESSGTASGCYTRSPLGACVSALPVSVTAYPITIGAGGTGNTSPSNLPTTQATSGSPSIFSTITSTGGGYGGNNSPLCQINGGNGGSGGGAGGQGSAVGGSGNTPPTSPPQGNNGGNDTRPGTPGSGEAGAGGGGATVAGCNSVHEIGGDGGNGGTTSISSSPTSYAGGGGGGTTNPSSPFIGTGGTGGGGNGGFQSPTGKCGAAGTTNTGGGGGGSGQFPSTNSGGNGGSGIVVIRYKFQ